MIVAYIVHREDVIVDYVDSDAGGPNAPVLDKRYLHGPGPDMVLAQEDIVSGTVLWLLTDHLGTMRDIVDHTGAAVDHIAYDSFGHVISQTAPSLLTRYLYTGREYEIETGLYYYLARFYDPCKRRSKSAAGGGVKMQRPVRNVTRSWRDVKFLLWPLGSASSLSLLGFA